MKKFLVRNGLIGTIADDVLGVQDAHTENIKGRISAMIARPGFKCQTDEDFEVTWKAVPMIPNLYEVICDHLGVMVFSDYVVVDGSGATMSGQHLLADGEHLFVQIQKSQTYSDPGSFEDGHPIDPDTGVAPASGDNLVASYAVSLVLSVAISTKPDPDLLTLGKLSRVGSVITFTDMRSDYGLQLVMAGYDKPFLGIPTNLEVRSLYHNDLLLERLAMYPTEQVNTTSPASNQTANRLFFEVKWNRVTDAAMYELRLTPITQQGVRLNPMYHMVPADSPGARITALVEVCEALEYEIGVRALENTPLRTKGPETILGAIAGLDLATLPMPAPSVSFSYLQGSVPNVVEIVTALPGAIRNPRGVQIFRAIGQPPLGGTLIEPTGQIIYDGPDGTFRYLIPEGKQCWFMVRSRGPGGAVSNCVVSETSFVGSPPGYPAETAGPEEITIDIPISVSCNYSEIYLDWEYGFQLLRFLNPSATDTLRHAIRRLEFHPTGSWFTGKATEGTIELVVGDNINVETKLEFNRDDFSWTRADPLPPSTAPTASKYYCDDLRKSGEWEANIEAPTEFGVFVRYISGGGSYSTSWNWTLAGNLRVILMRELGSAPVSS